MTASGEFTVCVVVKDRKDMMRACLDGIANQTESPAALVVIDNGSTDGTYEMLLERSSAFPFPMTVVQSTGSLGAIRNLAAQTATTRFVAFTDSDCVPRPDWLEQMVAAWTELDDGKLAVVQGRTVPDPAAKRERWDATQDLARFTNLYEACNIGYLREPLVSSPGFDESVGFFGEDTAAGWHMLRRGWKVAFAPEAIVEHVVTHVGLGWHLRRATRYGNFCVLIKVFPEMRERLLWKRYFLRRHNAEAWLALAGIIATLFGAVSLAVASNAAWFAAAGAALAVGLAACLPWLRGTWNPRVGLRAGFRDLRDAAAFDLLVMSSLAIGSVRHRTLVL